MFNKVRIGEKEVPMLAMASVDLYYKSVFHEDPIIFQTKMDEGEAIGFYQRIGFIMAKFAELKERKEMLKLTEDAFCDWMDRFDRADLMGAIEDIMKTYEGQHVSTSDAKKKENEQSDA